MILSKIDQELIIRDLGLSQLDVKNGLYNFRCDVCGDSKDNKYKKRGYIYYDDEKGIYKYKCHNCGVNYSLLFYVKKYHHDVYLKHIMNFTKNTYVKEEVLDFEKVSNVEIQNVLNELIESEKIIRAVELRDIIEPMIYIYDRKMPKSSLKKLYYTDNFYNHVYKPLKSLLNEDLEYNKSFGSDKRIFWLIKNRNNEIVGIQGRSIEPNSKLRYLTVKIKDHEPMMGGIEDINIKETVYITEGYLDSLFLKNSISLNCASFHPSLNILEKIGVKHIVFVYDNEPYNKEIKKHVEQTINESVKNKKINIGVCLLPKSLRLHGKDINDYVKNLELNKNQLINIIDSNTFYSIEAKLKFINW